MHFETLMETNKMIIAAEILIFNIFGVFGNLNLIYLTIARPTLRSKSSCLQCILSIFHLFCLLFELPNAFLLISGIELTRNQCFKIIFPYIFLISAQAIVVVELIIDLYLIIFLPALYLKSSILNYILIMLISPTTYGCWFLFWGYSKLNDELLKFCNPPFAFHPDVRRFWTLSNVILNSIILTLLFFLIIFFIFKGKHQKRDTKRIMKRLQVTTIFFVFSWYLALLATDLFGLIGLKGDVLFLTISNMIFFVLISYTQSFYVLMWRSSEYRMEFLKKWSFIPIISKMNHNTSTVSTVHQVQQHHSKNNPTTC